MEKGLVLPDIPGLLEGAHQGIGLGLAFLRWAFGFGGDVCVCLLDVSLWKCIYIA